MFNTPKAFCDVRIIFFWGSNFMTWLYVLIGLAIVYALVFGNDRKTSTTSNKANEADNHSKQKLPLKTNKKERFNNIKEFCNLNDYVVLDTETTGIDKHDQIIEIAILDADGNILLNTLVKPTVNVSPKAQNVHGISNKDLKKAPSWNEVYKKYLSVTEGKTILAYNSKYDKRLIQQTCKANNITNKRRVWGCIMLAYSEFMGNTKNGWYKWHKLESAAFNSLVTIRNSGSQQHRALYDSGMALGVLMYMKREVNIFLNDNQ